MTDNIVLLKVDVFRSGWPMVNIIYAQIEKVLLEMLNYLLVHTVVK